MEADSEIVAGIHTEYSGMKFAMFYLVEYAEALALSCILTTLFLGGWKGPILPPWLWFLGKVMVVFLLIVWVRATMPRVRIDQLMALAWKWLLPMALINLLVTGIEIILGVNPWLMVIINIVLTGIMILAFSRLFKVGCETVEA
jgi:NADH-quinone oxidoreductase subunit H